MLIHQILLISGFVLAVVPAQAFQITGLSPQGEVAQVRRLVVKFDERAVNFGDAKAPAPLSLSCTDAQAMFRELRAMGASVNVAAQVAENARR